MTAGWGPPRDPRREVEVTPQELPSHADRDLNTLVEHGLPGPVSKGYPAHPRTILRYPVKGRTDA
jgi:hypothetical protein